MSCGPSPKIAGIWFGVLQVLTYGVAAAEGIAAISTAGLGTAISALAGDLIVLMLDNPLGLIAAGLVLIGYGIYEVYKHWDGIKEFFASVGQAIASAFQWMWEKISDVFGWLVELGSRLIGWEIGLAQSLWQGMVDVGTHVWQGLRDGIKGGITFVENAVDELGDAVVGKLKGVLGIHSPSAVMAELGGFTAEGFALGMEGGGAEVQSAARQSLIDAALGGGGGTALGGGGTGSVSFHSEVHIHGAGGDGEEIGQAAAQVIRVEIGKFLSEVGYTVGAAA